MSWVWPWARCSGSGPIAGGCSPSCSPRPPHRRARTDSKEVAALATSISVGQVVLDCTDARELAEFYRELLGLRYRSGDEPPASGADERGQDWLVLRNPGGVQLAFQQVADLPEATWPDGAHPQMLHLDITVDNLTDFEAEHEHASSLG